MAKSIGPASSGKVVLILLLNPLKNFSSEFVIVPKDYMLSDELLEKSKAEFFIFIFNFNFIYY